MAPALLLSPNHDELEEAASVDLLSQTLLDSPYAFLQPSQELQAASLALAKRYLDPVAASVSDAQAARLQAARKKRKRGEVDDASLRDVLKLKQLHLDGFTTDHVWEQAKRVLDASHREVQRCVQDAARTQSQHSEPFNTNGQQAKKRVSFAEDITGSESESDAGSEAAEALTEDESSELDEATLNELEDEMSDGEGAGENNEPFEEESSGEYFDAAESQGEFVPDKHGLNDGFFSIDDFNKQTEFLEKQDANGDPDDGAASDEEDIDWAIDPSMQPTPVKFSAAENDDSSPEDGEDEDDEGGPTFGDADLNAPFGSSDDEDAIEEGDLDLEDPESNTNEIYYGQFFAPPPQQKSKSKKRKAPPKDQPSAVSEDTTAADVQRAIDDVRRDIFEDELSELSGSDGEGQEKNLSSHERRQAALAAQIRALEAEAVAKREWTLSGEARAADRPLNSLLEEDLEFERAGKPVPVVTPEVSSSIEELIKQRILARQFDEVTKRLPGSEALAGPTSRRGLVDIDERGQDQGLADLYEEEHRRANDPNYVDKRDAKLKAAHDEIERIWKDVSGKLDALSNWHYRPRPADVQVSVVTAAPRVTMEDARPGGIGLATEQSGLAPQEVYKAGEAKDKGEVATRAGGVVSVTELTREQKLRRRRREKERMHKQAGNVKLTAQGQEAKPVSKVQKQKNVVDDLKKGGVKVIGKGGELVDVEGKKIKAVAGPKGAGNLKL